MAESFNGTSQINTFTGGMNLDFDKSQIPKDSYSYAENVRLSIDKDGIVGAIHPIKGFKKLNDGDIIYKYYNGSEYEDGVFNIETFNILGVSTIRDHTCIIAQLISDTSKNYIFRLLLNDDKVDMYLSASSSLNINNGENREVSIVSYWEDDDNIKVYWADNYNPLRYCNISKNADTINYNRDSIYFDNIGLLPLNQPIFSMFESGSLKPGMIQYCYQLFNVNGAESSISPMSHMVQITASSTSDDNYIGSPYDSNSNKSVKMKIEMNEQSYDKIRIFSIHYAAVGEDPIVRIINEFDIALVNEYYQYSYINFQYFVDSGSYISELTLAEFLERYPYYFIPKVIDAKQGTLFAGNITEDTWVLNSDESYYDTRAFRFNKSGVSSIMDSSGRLTSISISDLNKDSVSDKEWLSKIGKHHDCINPYNREILSDYSTDEFGGDAFYDKFVWSLDKSKSSVSNIKGGTGRNVSFRVIHTKFGEDFYKNWVFVNSHEYRSMLKPYGRHPGIRNDISKEFGEVDYNEARLSTLDLYYNIPNMSDPLYEMDSGNRIPIDPAQNIGPINYSNPVIDAKFRSYQRDEIYRFGVVFHNEKGQTTPVSWIADIRMPSMLENDHRLFDTYGSIRTYVRSDSVFQVVTYPMGIQFSFENLPESVKRIEIVRCERKSEDRTILTQGLISQTAASRLTQYRLFHPLHSMTWSADIGSKIIYDEITNDDIPDRNRYMRMSYNGFIENNRKALSIDELFKRVEDSSVTKFPYIFTSPEICYYNDNVDQYLDRQNLKMQILYGISSPVDPYGTIESLSGFDGISSEIINKIKKSVNDYPYIYLSEYFYIDNINNKSNREGEYKSGSVCLDDSRYYLTKGGAHWIEDEDHKHESPELKTRFVGKMYVPFTEYTGAMNNDVSIVLSGEGYSTVNVDLLKNNNLIDIEEWQLADNIPYDGYDDIDDSLLVDEEDDTIIDIHTSIYKQGVGDRLYQNWVTNKFSNYRYASLTDYEFNKQINGPHGPCIIFNSSTIHSRLPNVLKIYSSRNDVYSNYFGDPIIDISDKLVDYNNSKSTLTDSQKAIGYSMNSTFLSNIKRNTISYGGDSFSNREASVYISTGFIINAEHDNGEVIAINNVNTFGGDTYIGLSEYINQHWYYSKQDPLDADSNISHWDRGQKAQIAIYYPCESSINHHLVNGAMYHNYVADGSYPNEIELSPGLTFSGFSQQRPLYEYNTAYSLEPTAQKFFGYGIYNEYNKSLDYRIQYSDLKENDEVSDSWLKFKPLNYKDVDTRFGEINGIKLFNNTLFFWQEDAFGSLSVNDRSLITDNNEMPLILGKGDVLDRYQYITIKNGLKEYAYSSIVTSAARLYWYDHKRNEISAFGESFDTISKSKNVQSWLNYNRDNIECKVITLYDKKYNEIHFKFNMQDQDIEHIVYSELYDRFVSFHTNNPDWYIDLSDYYYSIHDNNIYKMDVSDRCNLFFDGNQEQSKIQYIVNDNYQFTKVFDNVEYFANFDTNNNFHFYFNTNKQVSSSVHPNEIDLREDNFRFAIPRDEVQSNNYSSIAPSFNDRMRGKYIVSNLSFIPNGDSIFTLPYIKTSYRISNI